MGKTIIFDNHHHALFFWYQHFISTFLDRFRRFPCIIHLDQHSDRAEHPFPFDPNWMLQDSSPEVFRFVQEQTHVGNFITPLLKADLIETYLEIKTVYALERLSVPNVPYLLDIDLDFWAPEMAISFEHTLPAVQALMDGASFVTIASSPYFLDQSFALSLLSQFSLL